MDKKINLCGIENCKYNKNKICCLTRDPSVCFTNLCEIAKRDKQITNLETKLAEKEKKLAEYKRVCTIAHVEDLQIENMLLKGKDQDKISFAVEQLNLLYKTLTTESVWKALQTSWWLGNGECEGLRQIIDNQIKQLKEGK